MNWNMEIKLNTNHLNSPYRQIGLWITLVQQHNRFSNKTEVGKGIHEKKGYEVNDSIPK